jgi:hypothetical protein
MRSSILHRESGSALAYPVPQRQFADIITAVIRTALENNNNEKKRQLIFQAKAAGDILITDNGSVKDHDRTNTELPSSLRELAALKTPVVITRFFIGNAHSIKYVEGVAVADEVHLFNFDTEGGELGDFRNGGTVVWFQFDDDWVRNNYSTKALERMAGQISNTHPGVRITTMQEENYNNDIAWMQKWADEYGSPRLRRALARGYNAKGIYLREKLALDLHGAIDGFILDISKRAGHHTVINPTERALALEEEIQDKLSSNGIDAEVDIVWLAKSLPFDGQVQAEPVSTKPCEAIRIQGLLGAYDAYRVVTVEKERPLAGILATPGITSIWFDDYQTGFFSAAGARYRITEPIFSSVNEMVDYLNSQGAYEDALSGCTTTEDGLLTFGGQGLLPKLENSQFVAQGSDVWFSLKVK